MYRHHTNQPNEKQSVEKVPFAMQTYIKNARSIAAVHSHFINRYI